LLVFTFVLLNSTNAHFLPAIAFLNYYTTYSYYNNVPDTFALFTSVDPARRYFSLEDLVRPGVACLGGPTFNETLVATRLEKAGIPTSHMDWCKNIASQTDDQGWSERILRRKIEMSDLQVRYFSAGPVLLRHFTRSTDLVTVLALECFGLNSFTHIGFASTNKNVSGFAYIGCAQLGVDINLNFPTSSFANYSLPLYQPFYLQSTQEPEQCLEMANKTLHPMPCDSFAANQIFTGSMDDEIVGLTLDCFFTGMCHGSSFVVPSNSQSVAIGWDEEWEKVPVHLNDVYPYNHWELTRR
jgi:hypothetical protein